MTIPSRSELRTLLEEQQWPCLSIFLPMYRAGTEVQQNRVRLRNRLREAENYLFLKNLSSSAIERVLKPVEALVEDEQFWLHPTDGLAIFCSPDLLRTYHLPFGVKERLVIATHFSLKPLLSCFTDDGSFYILALSQNQIRLLKGTRYGVSQVELPDSIPQSLAEALRYDDPDNQVRYYSSSSGASVGKGGRRAAIFYGQGVGIDEMKDNLLRYFQQIDPGLHELLRKARAPLVLAGVEYLFPIYHEANTYPHLLEKGIPGNPDKVSAEVLHEEAWAVVEPYMLKAQQEAAAFYKEYAETERTSHEVKEIVPAAYYGRVAHLFVASDQEQWGIFQLATNTVHVHSTAKFGDEDLLDVAAIQTLRHGGAVYAVEREKMPAEAMIAAVFRY